MKKRTKILLYLSLTIALLVLGVGVWAAVTGRLNFSAKEKELSFTKQKPKAPVKDHILVKFKKGVAKEKQQKIHQRTGGKVKKEIKQIGVQIVKIPQGKGITPESFIETYKGNFKKDLEFAEPDYYVEMARVPNDTWYRTSQQIQFRDYLDGEPAWDVTVGDPSVMIAVLDSGVDFTHPDFEGRNLVRGWDFVDNDSDPTDANGHGTAVTGVLGAATDNGLGVASVSWQNAVLVVRIADYYGTVTTTRVAQGITYAADRGARAINMSLSSPSYSSAVASAVDYAWERGAVAVASAGNQGSDAPRYPAALPKVVGVAGLDGPDQLVYYSNYGAWVDVAAPCGARTLMVGGNVANVGGTSMSAPHVTGLLGLVFSVNPGLTPQQAVDIVRQTATDIGAPGFDDRFGWGRASLLNAVLAAGGSPSVALGNIYGRVNRSGATVKALQNGIVKAETVSSDSTITNYFLVNLPVGNYDVYFEAPRYQTQIRSGIAVEWGKTLDLRGLLVLEGSNSGYIEGKVIDSSTGLGVSGATVSTVSGPTSRSSSSTPKYEYLLSLLTSGNYTIKVEASGYQNQVKDAIVTSGQITVLDFALTPSTTAYGTISGRVTDSVTNVGIAQAQIAALQEGQVKAQVQTNVTGDYTLVNLPTGIYDIKVEKTNYQSQTYKGKIVTSEANIILNFSLTSQITTGAISGRVTSSTGQNLSLATVSAYRGDSLIKSTTTLTDGSYTLADLEPNTYTLRASLSGYQTQEKTNILVASGQTIVVNFSLIANPSQEFGSLTGAVSLDFQAIAGAKVEAQAVGSRTKYSTTTNSSGVYTFANLPAGTYTLKASLKGGYSAQADNVQIQGGSLTNQDLDLIKATGGGKKK